MRLILLLTSLAFSVLFMLINPTGQIGFPFSDMVLSSENYFYYLFEHLVPVLLSVVILELEPKYRLAVTVFLIIQIIDTLDYVLFYGERWTPYLPTWNVLKVGIMGLTIFIDINRNGKTS
jgi:hypothetical protein